MDCLDLRSKDVEVVGRVRSAVVVEQALAVVGDRCDVAGEGVDAFGEREALDFATGEIAGVERLAAIDVGGPHRCSGRRAKSLLAWISHLSAVIQVIFFEAMSSRATLS